MALNAAQACVAMLRVTAHDAQAEREALARLAAWAGQYTPVVSLAPPQALLLEVAGSRRLFGGDSNLREQVRQGLAELGFTARSALAPTPLAALWLARAGGEARVTRTAQLAAALAPLPLAALEPDARQGALLAAMGLGRLGDCLRLPRAGLAQRLGPEWVLALDRALGRLPDPRPAYTPPLAFTTELNLPAPVTDSSVLLFGLHRLVIELGGFLRARQAAVQALSVTLAHRRPVPPTALRLTLVAPTRDVAHLTGLLRERLERLALPAPVEALALDAETLCLLPDANLALFAAAHAPPAAAAEWLERLQARLGREAVHGLKRVADHRPEYAWAHRPPVPGAPGGIAIDTVRRPLWLLPAPLALAERDGRPVWDGALTLEPGRERIEAGWWDDRDIARDYFVATTATGTRLWVYRELTGARGWFLHGLFA